MFWARHWHCQVQGFKFLKLLVHWTYHKQCKIKTSKSSGNLFPPSTFIRQHCGCYRDIRHSSQTLSPFFLQRQNCWAGRQIAAKTTGLIWPRLFCILVHSDKAMAAFISAKQHLRAKTTISHRRKTLQKQHFGNIATTRLVIVFLCDEGMTTYVSLRSVFNTIIIKLLEVRLTMTRKNRREWDLSLS